MNHQPLAYRMRPRTIDEVIGQEHLVSPGKIINRMVVAKQLSSMILYLSLIHIFFCLSCCK